MVTIMAGTTAQAASADAATADDPVDHAAVALAMTVLDDLRRRRTRVMRPGP